MNLRLDRVDGNRDRRAVENLYPLYIHDLSAFTDYYRIDDIGRWVPDHLPNWLHGDLQQAFLIRADGTPAGFSFVAQAPFPHMTPHCDYEIREFFVANPFRRQGVGRWAATTTLDLYRGTWAIVEIVGNIPARA